MMAFCLLFLQENEHKVHVHMQVYSDREKQI